ncbi:MAG TPA: hypothetical protein VGE07_23060, partial [Herpetosiphonaceae bacterium]
MAGRSRQVVEDSRSAAACRAMMLPSTNELRTSNNNLEGVMKAANLFPKLVITMGIIFALAGLGTAG